MIQAPPPGQKATLAKNALANYGGALFTFLYGMLLTPFIIRTLGDTLYGAWTLVMSAGGYLALLDFGLGSALSKYTAEYENKGKPDVVNQLTSTLFFSFVGVGAMALVAAFLLSRFFGEFFSIPAAYEKAASAALIVLGLNLALILIFNIFNALAVGFQRFDIVNLARSASLVIGAALTVGALLMGGNLVALATIACVTTIVQIVCVGSLFARWERPIPIRWSAVRRSMLRLLLSYSVFMFIMMACGQIEHSSRPLLVGRLVGVDAVTYYAVGEKLSSLVRQATFPVAGVLFPSFAALSAHNSPAEYGQLLVTGLRFSTLVALPISAITAILAGPLIAAWIGPAYSGSSTIAVLLIGQAFVGQQLVAASSLLNGIGRLGLYTALHIFAVLFSVGFALLCTPALGIAAIAAGSLIAWSVVLAITLTYASRIAALRTASMLHAAWLRPGLATALVSMALYLFARRFPPIGLLNLALEGGIAFGAYLVLAWAWCLRPDERRKIIRAFGRRLGVSACS